MVRIHFLERSCRDIRCLYPLLELTRRSANARLPASADRATEMHLGPHTVVADDPTNLHADSRGPTPLDE